MNQRLQAKLGRQGKTPRSVGEEREKIHTAKAEERPWEKGIVWHSWALWCEVVSRSSSGMQLHMLTGTGHGSGIVVGTGKDSEFGVIFSMMQAVGLVSLRPTRS